MVNARKKSHGSRQAKHNVLVLQAFADILIGLSPFNQRFHDVFESSSRKKLACWQGILGHIYVFYLTPFIHAASMILLTAESYLFWRTQGQYSHGQPQRTWLSQRYLFAGILPWCSGVLIILPLVLIGFDFNNCSVQNYSLFRVQSFHWVSVILPGILAFLTASTYLMSPMPLEKQLFGSPRTSLSDDSPTIEPACLAYGLPKYRKSVHTNPAITKVTFENVDNTSKNASQANMSDSNFTNCTIRDSDEMFTSVDGHGRSGFPSHTEQLPTTALEKRTRLIAAILFCACSMPTSILDLMSLSDSSDSGSIHVLDSSQVPGVNQFLYRFHILRSLFSSLVWAKEYL
ncbi:hypothetical protein ElyMa_005321200 [Elysia marginata]|uniref:G-protein coupled receptors family 1 profile domain-containing protein n=1 Tax=Elysia marginata TaxID=1093978 RepID=A0AAV4K429_9GAST|nr:hypothetical protein ElyMa_005321200 [Elysia marginata]